MMNTLMIPMLVEAYAAGKITPVQKDVPKAAPNYKTAMAASVLGSRSTPGVNARSEPLKPGIHIHFILPDAFTHSVDGESYPLVPDRYLVGRIWQDSRSKKLCVKSFAVESNFISTDKSYSDSITIPMFDDPDSKKRWRYMGRQYPVGKPPAVTGTEAYLSGLTAMGPGDAMFAAYYPSCRSVFGCYDDLADLTEGLPVTLTYFVAGYFSEPSDDPLSGVVCEEDFKAVLGQMHLSASPETGFCTSCVLYGAIEAIEWKGFTADYGSIPQGKIYAAVGNTSAEALSAVVKRHFSTDDALSERLLTALQYDLYDETERVDGNFRIDDDIHFQSFSRCESQDECPHLYMENGEDDLPRSGADYSDLMKLGREAGRLKRRLHFEKQKLSSVWEQYILLYEDGEELPESCPTREVMLGELHKICDGIDGLALEAEKAEKTYESRLKDLCAQLPETAKQGPAAGDVFFAPKDPVLLLFGEGIRRTYAFGEDGRFCADGTLFCQRTPISCKAGQEALWERGICLLDDLSGCLSVYKDLLIQTVLICSGTMDALRSFFPDISITGEQPSELAVNKNPLDFTTLFMLWEVEYFPTQLSPSADHALDHWDFVYGDTSLVYQGGREPDQTNAQRISGRMVLTPHAVKAFQAALERYLDIYEDEELKGLAVRFGDLPAISQNLSGFSDYFSSFWQALQFPVAGIGDDEKIVKAVASLTANERRSILLQSPLLPVRGGFMKISFLSLVGSFGQVQQLEGPSYYNIGEVDFAETFSGGIKNYGLLPAEFSVPARLNADFVCASDDNVISSLFPETSPVCGILLPELLNRRLLAYSSGGVYLGMIKTVWRDGGIAARWLSAPGVAPDFENVSFPDARLKKFLKALVEGTHAFEEFQALLDRYLDAKHDYSSLIWGRPLVLARVSVSFEFYGGPQFSKKIEDFGKYETNGAEKTRFPLKFGDMQRVSDGLMGCFAGDDFTKMIAPPGSSGSCETQEYISCSDGSGVTLSNSDGEQCFTLLMEPGSEVHIQTGLLPVKSMTLDPVHVRAAEQLSLAAEISPILVSDGRTQIPYLQTPDGKNYEWYALEETDYRKFDLLAPTVSFDETMLTDGWIVCGDGRTSH